MLLIKIVGQYCDVLTPNILTFMAGYEKLSPNQGIEEEMKNLFRNLSDEKIEEVVRREQIERKCWRGDIIRAYHVVSTDRDKMLITPDDKLNKIFSLLNLETMSEHQVFLALIDGKRWWGRLGKTAYSIEELSSS